MLISMSVLCLVVRCINDAVQGGVSAAVTRSMLLLQDESQVVHASKLAKEEGVLDFRKPAWTVHNKVVCLPDPFVMLTVE